MKTAHTLEDYSAFKTPEFPKMVVIAINYVCNALCPGCAYTNSDIRDSYNDTKFMSEETFKRIADEVGKENSWLRISGGGEPMIQKNIIELIRYAKNKGCKVGLINNGSLLNEKAARELLEMNIDMIEFSVDACDEQTYNTVRKGLSFNTLINNVQRTFKLRNKLGSKTKIIASAINQTGVDVDEVEDFWKSTVDVFQKRKFLTWGINSLENSADTTPYLPPEDRIPCPIIFDRLLIDSRGRAMFCIYDIAGKTDMGNVQENSIKEIWNSKRFKDIRDLHLSGRGAEIDICKTCEDWQFRSWNYNYFKITKDAETKRVEKLNKNA